MNPYLIIGVPAVLAVLFGGPALVGPARRYLARQAAARDQAEADTEEGRQAAETRQRALAQLWTDDPETAGVGEALTYQAQVRGGLVQRSQEAHRRLRQQADHVTEQKRHVRDGEPVTPAYRLRVLAGLALFLVVFALGIGLDYLIFRGLHPTGTWLLPFALACLAVIGITAGSVIFLGASRHRLIHKNTTPYVRRVVCLAGALLAAGITVYMIVIAPYRSAPAGEARISLLEQRLASDQSQVLATGGSNRQLVTADRLALAKARTDLAQAQKVDRWSAAVLAILDIPLSEAGFLGAELLLLGLALSRSEQARRRAQDAADAIQGADHAFTGALHDVLTRHGHHNADELIPKIITRVSILGLGTEPGLGEIGAPTPAVADQ